MDQVPDLIVYPMTDIMEKILDRLDPEGKIPRHRVKEIQIHISRTRVVVYAVDETGCTFNDEHDTVATRAYDFDTTTGKLKEVGEK